jgi:hypothetical protein
MKYQNVTIAPFMLDIERLLDYRLLFGSLENCATQSYAVSYRGSGGITYPHGFV